MTADIVLPVNLDAEIAALKQWIRPFEAPLYRLALNLTGDPQDAESVLAAAFLRAWREFGPLADQQEARRRLARIIVSEALPILRARYGDVGGWLDEPSAPFEPPAGEIVPWDGNPRGRYTQQEWQQILLAALGSLRPLERVVFVLRDVERFSAECVAEALSLPLAQVRVRLQRARLLLREKLNLWCRAALSAEEEKELLASYAELCT